MAGRYLGKDREEAACQALEDSARQLCAYAKAARVGETALRDNDAGQLCGNTKATAKALGRAPGGMPVVLEIFDRDIEKKSLVGPNDIALRIVQNVREECG